MPNWTLEECQRCVGPGWAGLVRRIYEGLPEDTFIMQVKEKFGGLRFYTGGVPEEVYRLISDVEDESYRVCEVCGKPGKLRPGGWILTLCDGCHNMRLKDYEKDS